MEKKKKLKKSQSVFVDPKKARSPTDKPLTPENLREGRVPLGVHPHAAGSPNASNRARKARLGRDARLERLGGQ